MNEDYWKDKYLKLADDVRCVIESYDYMIMVGNLEYSLKNQTCKHGNPGYNWCEACACDFLSKSIEHE